ncbi:hypothetical protein CF319_g863 [Tilletia indica]|uniref:Uncharacterized protein n=1 Tax=Tilletia indica TaxID=43049 RepID=A0A177TVU4_9BASI|nr:hypothetical protein CF319_g863 [Tilletia indica]KAE8256423.1 hypothetical protein A4X13_0g2636 [Tilletia indica]
MPMRQGLEAIGAPFPKFDADFHLLPLLRPYPEAPYATAPPEAEFAFLEVHRPPRIAFRFNGVDWIVTTHVLPGAYPRMHDAATSPPSQPLFPVGVGRKPGASAEEIREAQWALLDDLVKEHPPPTYYPPSTKLDAEIDGEKRKASRTPQLWSVVERIVPMRSVQEQDEIDRAGEVGLTVVACHANGFHKETYEPFFHSLVEELSKRTDATAPRIDEIWSVDTIDSGDGGLLNGRSLGRCIHWFDQPRDILNFLQFYLPRTAASVVEQGTKHPASKEKGIQAGSASRSDAALRPTWPTRILPRLNQGEGLQGRRIVLLGHSFSGAAVAALSALEPKLTERSILIDPVILSSKKWEDGIVGPWPPSHVLGQGSAVRQEVWPSSAAALASFKKKPFFASWDPRALELFVRFGLRPVKPDPSPSGTGGPQTLSMNKWRETEAFASNWVARYIWALLERSRGISAERRSPLHIFTMSASSNAGIYGEYPDMEAEISELVRSQTRECTAKQIPGGHLVVQQQPSVLAVEIVNVLAGSAPSQSVPQARL